MERSKLIIIGAGNISRSLMRMLSRDFELTCIDKDPLALKEVAEIRGDSVRLLEGDATSRLFLEEAGIAEADTVVITTSSQKINSEVARVLNDHFSVPRIVAVGITREGIDKLEDIGVEVESIFEVSAMGLRNRLERKTKAVQGVGIGKNEILEVEVHPNSRVANKTLQSLKPNHWRAGIIYREGNIVIPTGETVLRPKDRVVILGDPQVLKTVSEILSFRFEHFPLEYGRTLVCYVGGEEKPAFFEEIAYLFSVFPLERIVVVTPEKGSEIADRLQITGEEGGYKEVELITSGKSALESLREVYQEPRNRGLMVLSKPRLIESLFAFAARSRRKNFLQDLTATARCPILLAGGTFPYEKVVVPCVMRAHVQHAMETTMELSAAVAPQLSALFARPSEYIAGENEESDYTAMKKTVSDLGHVYKQSIHSVELDGNPVETISSALREYNLMVMDVGSWREQGLLRSIIDPDVPWNIVRRSSLSTLLLPPLAEII